MEVEILGKYEIQLFALEGVSRLRAEEERSCFLELLHERSDRLARRGEGVKRRRDFVPIEGSELRHSDEELRGGDHVLELLDLLLQVEGVRGVEGNSQASHTAEQSKKSNH